MPFYETKISERIREITLFLMTFVILLGATSAANATEDTMCRSTGNVEVEITPNAKTSQDITFTFTNYNNYQVSVNATFNLTDIDGKEKSTGKVLVIPAKGSKSAKFNSTNQNMNNFMVGDCGCTMDVLTCD